MDILVISARATLWRNLSSQFELRGASMRRAASLEEGLKELRRSPAALAVLDLNMDNSVLRDAVFRVLSVDAMIHTAAVSDMSAEEFHDAMEGLGMLMKLPMEPSPSDIDRLMEALHRVSA